jgi:hypothetical protein
MKVLDCTRDPVESLINVDQFAPAPATTMADLS